MTRAGSFDSEIGKGRKKNEDNSSSSRDSSPAPRLGRAPKRSFSPPSDDGDDVVQNETKEASPPPVERPIIRQAVAFSTQSSQVPVMTYKAKVLQPKKNQFLPGQAVPLPSKKKKAKRPTYSAQTSRFRLETYDPTPPSAPPTTHGTGPYSSLYRSVGSTGHRRRIEEPQAGPSITVSSLPNNSNAYLPSNRLSDGSNAASSIPKLQTPNAQTDQPNPTTNDRTTSSLNSQSQSQGQAQTAPPSPPPRQMSVDSHSHSTFVTDTSMTIRDRSSPGPYYRRNYDDKDFSLPRDRRRVSRNTSITSSSPDSYTPSLAHVVTLLIKDIRSESGEPDHQLAEVQVPLKKADDWEGGWWADAKDIAAQLQAGAARIDGPARVYTMRGKYRQFILRVTAENRNEIVSANVPVSAERTVDLTIELLHPPGAPTRPVQRPRLQWSRDYDDIQRPEDRMNVDLNRSNPRKRRASPSFDYPNRLPPPPPVHSRDRGRDSPPRRRSPPPYGDRPLYNWPTNQESRSWRNDPPMDRGQRRRSPSPARRSHASPPLPSVHAGPSYPHREADSDEELRDERFIGAVQRVLRQDSDEYFKAIGGNRVCDIVRQYELVSRMFSKWVGKRPPGFSQPIEEIHMAKALAIDEPHEFISNCEETLALLNFYGRRGRVNKDPRVIEMLDDQNPPPANSDPTKMILRLLRAVDDAWRNGGRSGPLLNGITLPEPSDTRPAAYSVEAKSKGPPIQDQITSRPPSHAYPNTAGLEERGSVDTTTRNPSKGKALFPD